MQNRWHIMGLLLLNAAGAARLVAQDRPGSLAPTDVLHMMIAQMLANPQRPQAEITQPLLPLARTDDTARVERFALGEAAFLAFEPELADSIFRPLMDGTDFVARTAWHRVIRMELAAFSRPDSAERLLATFYTRFSPTPEDLSYGSQHVAGLVEGFRRQGELDRAVELIAAEVNRLPFDAAYSGFGLPSRYIDVFRSAGREDVALALLRRVRNGLEATAAREGITGNPYAGRNRGAGLDHRAGVLHRTAEGLLADDPAFDRDALRKGLIHDLLQRIRGTP